MQSRHSEILDGGCRSVLTPQSRCWRCFGRSHGKASLYRDWVSNVVRRSVSFGNVSLKCLDGGNWALSATGSCTPLGGELFGEWADYPAQSPCLRLVCKLATNMKTCNRRMPCAASLPTCCAPISIESQGVETPCEPCEVERGRF